MTIKVIAWYEIVAGSLGLLLSLLSLISTGSLGLILPIALFAATVVAGAALLRRRRLGFALSTIVQAPQAVSFAILGNSWSYFSGVVLGARLTPKSTRMYVEFGAEFSSTWGAPMMDGMLGLNIVPLILIGILWRLRRDPSADLTPVRVELNEVGVPNQGNCA
ncbi:MAG TPA: hypothetical protein VF039_13730 [Longimicrobiales bacterium]